MNTTAKKAFEIIANSASILHSEVASSLETYRTERDEARENSSQFKDESAIFERQRSFLVEECRGRIEKAERVFANAISEQVRNLRSELMEHLNVPLSSDFCNQLSLIHEYGLKPTRSELMHLIKLNNGNSFGLSALQSVLTENDSQFRLKYSSTEDFEQDLQTIEGLADFPRYIPVELHAEGAEVFTGIQRDFRREDGTTYQDGRIWDGIGLAIMRNDFEQRIKAIEGMSDRWANNASYPSIEAVFKAEQDQAEHNEQTVVNEPETPVEVEIDDAGVETGKAMGRAKAEGQAKYYRTMDEYMK